MRNIIMTIDKFYKLEAIPPGWQLRHVPTGTKIYLSKDRPSDEKIQEAYRILRERVIKINEATEESNRRFV